MKRLVEILATALPDLPVHSRMFVLMENPSPLAALDAAIPDAGGTRSKLVGIIDENPAAEFVMDWIGRRLKETVEPIFNQPPEPLGTLAGFSDAKAVAGEIIADLNSLPWDYVFSLPMPKVIGDRMLVALQDSLPLELSPTISMVRGDDATMAAFPAPRSENRLLGLLGGIHGLLAAEWHEDTIYLQVRRSGYVSRFGQSATAFEAEEALRAFAGVSMAHHLFRFSWSTSNAAAHMSRPSYMVHRRVDGAWVLDCTPEFDTTLAAAMSSIELNKMGDITDRALLDHALPKVRTCFSRPEASGRITRSGRWLFGSSVSRDETMAFVQGAVALEILLGEEEASDEVGLGELLANRCAYLIGESQEHRKEVLREFRAIYRVRSKIVHVGKGRLTRSEHDMLSRLRWMTSRAIQAETKLLERDHSP
ncbi:hypothetical protein JHFBIEKO_0203 [Methylobacterium mesophilicum]|nr:hypothetical protein JHFBIEKO_0203 [Methylobacterium mesophilicum]